MSSLSDYDLILPQFPSEEEWRQAISELEALKGVAKDAAIVRVKGLNLLREVNEPKATAERLGWLNLWTKTFTALDSAVSAFEYRSDLVLQMIARCTFEWQLHAHVIMDPISDLHAQEKSNPKVVVLGSRERSLRETVDRLRAYTAWCLWSDKDYYEEFVHPRNLAGIWDTSPAKEILADGQRLELYKRFFGSLDVEIDEKKLAERRQEMKRMFTEKIERIDQWLSDPHLKPWINKIRELSENNKSKNKGPVTFFSLFDSSVGRRLKQHGMKFGYAAYTIGSMILHGSTMGQFIMIGTSGLGPKIGTDDSDVEGAFGDIVSKCNHIFFLLSAIDHFVLKRRELRR